MVQEEAGRRVVELLVMHGTDLQAGLVMEELLLPAAEAGRPPLILALALGRHGQGVMAAVVGRAEGDTLAKLRDTLDLWRGKVAGSEVGRMWAGQVGDKLSQGGRLET